MSYKSVSLRLNLEDESERRLYEKIIQSAEFYSSTAGFLKHALVVFYEIQEVQSIQKMLEENLKEYKQEIQRIIQEEVVREGTLILSALLSETSGSANKTESSKNILPSKSDKIPLELSGVLEMME